MNFAVHDQQLWAGTAQSWHEAVASFDRAISAKASNSLDDMLPPLWEKRGSTAVVNVHGSLVAGSAGFYRLFGFTGYDDIAEALVQAVGDKGVDSILLDVRSGGGHVEGVNTLSAFMADVDSVKPISTFASGTMASAAYWLGVNGRHVMASDTSVVGSIGVLAIHAERSKQLADDGVTVNVIRSGKYKALGNPYEPLSDVAKAEMQSQVDYLGDIFTQHVAEKLGTDAKTVNARMGQGREFIGTQAVAAGLVEQITDMRGALAVAQSVGKLQSAANMPAKR